MENIVIVSGAGINVVGVDGHEVDNTRIRDNNGPGIVEDVKMDIVESKTAIVINS